MLLQGPQESTSEKFQNETILVAAFSKYYSPPYLNLCEGRTVFSETGEPKEQQQGMLRAFSDFIGLTSPPQRTMRAVNQDLLSVLDAGDEAAGTTIVASSVADGVTEASAAAALYGGDICNCVVQQRQRLINHDSTCLRQS